MTPISVLIAGGGVAGLETVLALRELAGPRVAITMLAPEPDFMYRAPSVGESFSVGHGRRFSLSSIAEDLGFELVADGLAAVKPDEHRAVLASGEERPYDALVLALGARQKPAYPAATTYAGDRAGRDALSGLLADLEGGYVKRIAFVMPHGPSWQLPLYELAIMTAREAWDQGIDGMQISLITAEDAPLAAFGANASRSVAEMLEAEGITFIGSSHVDVRPRAIVLDPGARRLEVDRVVTLPALEGPRVPGVPADDAGFHPIDEHGRVAGVPDVYAAGRRRELPHQAGRACHPAGRRRRGDDRRRCGGAGRAGGLPPRAAGNARDRRGAAVSAPRRGGRRRRRRRLRPVAVVATYQGRWPLPLPLSPRRRDRAAGRIRRMSRRRVLVAGGGVAALETVLALRSLAQDRVQVTLLAPERDFVYRPLTVSEPFGGHVRRYPL
jgi:sulfide:quinone oxidoreductase